MIGLNTHLGMGDAILQNGLVRELARRDCVLFPSKREYYESNVFMFRDCPEIRVVDESFNLGNNVLKLGWKGDDFCVGCHFDESFYRQAGVGFWHRLTSFQCQRLRSNEIHHRNGRYAFVHDKPDMPIQESLVGNNLEIVRPFGRSNVFDYCALIEEADEVHCIDSMFACMCECMMLAQGKRFYHGYARKMEDRFKITLSSDWKVL